jgi:hypothetical protein
LRHISSGIAHGARARLIVFAVAIAKVDFLTPVDESAFARATADKSAFARATADKSDFAI